MRCYNRRVKPKQVKGEIHACAEHEAPRYWECPECGYLSADPDFGGGVKPCPHCGAPGDSRRVFPPERLHKLDGRIRCQAAVEGGAVAVEAPLPALFTTQRGLNEPRYASLPGIMKAKKKPLEVKTIADLGVDPARVGAAGRKVVVKALRLPPERKAVRMIKGETPEAVAAELVRVLHEEARLI